MVTMVHAVVESRTDTTKALEMAEIWSEKVRCSSNINPRLRTEWVVLSEELCILSSCVLSPMSKHLVLGELIVRRLAVIQEEIC